MFDGIEGRHHQWEEDVIPVWIQEAEKQRQSLAELCFAAPLYPLLLGVLFWAAWSGAIKPAASRIET